MIVQVTPNGAADILKDKRLIVLWFSAEWCAPCKQVTPIIKDIAQLRWPNIVVAKVDMDTNEALVTQHKIEHVPTILLLKNGVVVDKIIGVNESFKSKLANSINANI